jgi:AraC-like DNA-binding protein
MPGLERRERYAASRLLTAAGSRLHFEELPGSVDELRRAVTKDLSAVDVETWLKFRLSPKGIIEAGLVHTIALLLSGANIDKQSVADAKRWCNRLGLPTWGQWKTAGRLVRGLLELQTDPTARISDVAKLQGYGHASAFSRACAREFGESPSAIKDRVGWEWLFQRFLQGRSH